MTKGRPCGFTLIEVIVALAIAGGSLVLLLSAYQASMFPRINAHRLSQVMRAAETKFDECRCGATEAKEGDLPGNAGWRWRLRVSNEEKLELEGLKQVLFTVYSPEAPFKPYRTYQAFTYKAPDPNR